MSHEITSTDSAIFQGTRAWHGLGYVVEDWMSPLEAVEHAALDWYVYSTNGVYGHTLNGDTIADSSKCFTYREDTNEILGYVSKDYNVFQNVELARLARQVGENVKVESAFSMMGGKRVVILLKGNTIEVGSANDPLYDYFALINGHDGKMSLSALPTSVRVVCNNTLQMAINMGRRERSMYSITHNGDWDTKLDSLSDALKQYHKTRDLFAGQVNALAAVDVTKDSLDRFWKDCFSMLVDPKIIKDEKKGILAATSYLEHVQAAFDAETSVENIRPSMWTASQAVTNWVQHRIGTRGRKASYEAKATDILMGKRAQDSLKVVNAAMAF